MASNSRSNAGTILLAVVALLMVGFVTFAVVKVAGGTDVSPGYSNTPNAVVPGPPTFK